MNKKTLFLTTLGILALPVFALAQLHNYGTDIDPQDIIDSIETVIWVIFGAVTIICFVISGIQFLTAQGAPEKLKAAKSSFIWGIVGIVVGILAYSIITIVSDALTGGSFFGVIIHF